MWQRCHASGEGKSVSGLLASVDLGVYAMEGTAVGGSDGARDAVLLDRMRAWAGIPQPVATVGGPARRAGRDGPWTVSTPAVEARHDHLVAAGAEGAREPADVMDSGETAEAVVTVSERRSGGCRQAPRRACVAMC